MNFRRIYVLWFTSWVDTSALKLTYTTRIFNYETNFNIAKINVNDKVEIAQTKQYGRLRIDGKNNRIYVSAGGRIYGYNVDGSSFYYEKSRDYEVESSLATLGELETV